MHSAVSPLVSILTPTYNHERFIVACIQSALRQTYSNWEQIIIDDGSSDNTAHLVAGFRDPRIVYQRQVHRGPLELAHTYNRAWSLAKGEFVAILEGDDFWPPDKLTKLMPAFLDDDVVLAYAEAVDVGATGLPQPIKSHTTRLRKGLSHAVLFNDPIGSATKYMRLAQGRSLVSPSTVVIRGSALQKIGGFQYVAGLPLTDYPTFMELSLMGKFYYSAEALGYRRRHQNSVTVGYARTIHEKVSSFTTEFLVRHHKQMELSPSRWQELEENWREAEDKLNFSEGRSLLLQKRWSEARIHFRAGSKSKDLMVGLAACAGLVLSWLHLNIELLMKLGGGSDLRVQPDSEIERAS